MAGGRPRTGSVRQKKNGLWYASVAPGPGQSRKEVPFGRNETAARTWLQAAVAAQAAGQAVPGGGEFLSNDGPALVAPTPSARLTDQALAPRVLGLDGGLVPGRGHDANAVFRAWLRHQYRNLEAGGGLRECNVVSAWEDHILPFLLEHGDRVGGSGIFCIEELHLTLAGELRGHLLRGGRHTTATTSAPEGPALHGSVTVREAVTEFGLPKSTVENYRRAGRFPNATNDSGVWVIPREDLRQAGLLADDRPGRGRPINGAGLAAGTTANIMWVLGHVVQHAKALGIPIQGDPTHGLARQNKKRRQRAAAKTVTLKETRALASHLHVVHQLVLLCLRTLGMRISELYGVKVGDLLTDGHHGLLLLRAQGGRKFLVRDGDEMVKRDHITDMKNGESARAIVLPPVVLELVQHVIRVFHTDPETGRPDREARLVPGIKEPNRSGQAGFRSALAQAAAAEAIANGTETEALLVPHDLRKSLVTDLAWDASLHELATRRYVGHAPGNDVHTLSYVLDQPQHQEIVKVAQRIHDDITRDLDGALVVPTDKRPAWGQQNPIRTRLNHIDALLLELGWQVPAGLLDRRGDDADEVWLDTAAVASVLGRPLSTARAWLSQGVIRGQKRDGHSGHRQWFARLSDVDAFRDHLHSLLGLPAVAAELGLTYADAYSLLRRLGLSADKDARTGELVITDEVLLTMRAEVDRQRALENRAMPLAEAAQTLGVQIAVAVGWMRTGRLAAEPERGPAGRVMVKRSSVEALAFQRSPRRA